MASLKEVRNRITSVTSTQQITSAMKMVSAAKLRRAQDAVTRMRPYAAKLRELLENLSAQTEGEAGSRYTDVREVKNVLLVVITSNRGLCGAFNSNVIKKANELIRTEFAGVAGSVSVLTAGRKATDHYRRQGGRLLSSHDDVFENPVFSTLAPVADRIMEDFASGKFDRIDLIYNQFKNAATQVLMHERFLPVVKPEKAAKAAAARADYIFEPDKESILRDLIPRSLRTQLHKAVLDSNAAEHGARMTAMHMATENARDLIKELRLTYNKARQATITKEILEIVGGAEALKQ